MWFLNSIVSLLWTVSQYFFHIYTTIHNWPYPFYFISYPFYSLGSVFASLYTYFGYFNNWVDYVASKVTQILTITQITSYFQGWINYATTAYYWVRNAPSNVLVFTNTWWSTTQYTVLAWIDDVRQWTSVQIYNLTIQLTNLQVAVNSLLTQLPTLNEVIAWFSDWWAKILSPLTSWWNERLLDINALLNSRMKEWFPFYDDLAGLWNDIKLFFTDPLQWLYDRLDEFFERFW